jgi:hypothetical protein
MLLGSVVAGVGVTAPAAPAASSTISLSGVEVAATSTRGTFVGKGHGPGGTKVAWTAVVKHTALRGGAARITGGSFAMGTLRGGHRLNVHSGMFTGGSVRLLASAAGCHDQRYAVRGRLARVKSPTTGGGTGTVSIRLTHHRRGILGRCVTYGASVTGTVSLTS